MDLTRMLSGLPPNLLLLLLIIVSGGINVLVTYIVRKVILNKRPGAFNDVIGLNFAAVSGFYALLVAFVVADALSDLSDVQSNVDREQSLAKNFYRQIRSYPDAASVAELKTEYTRYIHLVIEDEFPKMGIGKVSDTTSHAFGRLFRLVEKLKPEDNFTQVKAQFMFETLNELATYRSLRSLDGKSEIPYAMWLALIVGGLITSILAALLSVENFRYHLTISLLMGAFIGLLFFLIIILDHPFSGCISIEPEGYKAILQMEQMKY